MQSRESAYRGQHGNKRSRGHSTSPTLPVTRHFGEIHNNIFSTIESPRSVIQQFDTTARIFPISVMTDAPLSHGAGIDHTAHFFHSLPSGGLTSTGAFLTSSQLVLSVVPPLSW